MSVWTGVLTCFYVDWQVTAKRQDEEQRHRFMTHARATQ
jgi:hypothetical protein